MKIGKKFIKLEVIFGVSEVMTGFKQAPTKLEPQKVSEYHFFNIYTVAGTIQNFEAEFESRSEMDKVQASIKEIIEIKN